MLLLDDLGPLYVGSPKSNEKELTQACTYCLYLAPKMAPIVYSIVRSKMQAAMDAPEDRSISRHGWKCL